ELVWTGSSTLPRLHQFPNLGPEKSGPLTHIDFGGYDPMAKVKRPDFELAPQLEEQVGFLCASMDAYDAGAVAEAKRIAVALRVLLYDHAQSVSLLGQVGLKRCDFADTAGDLIRGNLGSESRLTVMEISADRARFIPRRAAPPRLNSNWRTFERWWPASVIKTRGGETFSRAEIVLTMADQDGGAHIDPSLEEKYYRLTRDNSLNWTYTGPDGTTVPLEGPQSATIRQIGHEVELTLQRWAVGTLPEQRRLPRRERRSN
ncbi:MAG: hypothetical protein ABI782_00670, partial [Anaerolineaceae bacterium]